MKLLVNELDTIITQQDVTTSRKVLMTAIRAHLYRHNFPTGSVKIELRDENQRYITETETLAISALDIVPASGANFFHGHVRFYISHPLQANKTYYFRLVGVGYTFSEAAYVGWCKDFDLRVYEPDYTPNVGYNSALGLQIFEIVRR